MTEERLAKIKQVLNKRQTDIAVVLENVEDMHNVYAVMRSCDAIGVQDLYVLTTEMGRHRKSGNSSSSSANKWLTIHEYDYLDKCMETVRRRYKRVFASYIDEDVTSFYDIDYTEPIALVFGNERIGISDEMLANCTGKFVIPQVGMIHSLNISVACAVTLYEAKRQRLAKGCYDGAASMPDDRVEELTSLWSVSRHKK